MSLSLAVENSQDPEMKMGVNVKNVMTLANLEIINNYFIYIG